MNKYLLDRKYWKYCLLWKIGEVLYINEKYLWIWYKHACRIRKEDIQQTK